MNKAIFFILNYRKDFKDQLNFLRPSAISLCIHICFISPWPLQTLTTLFIMEQLPTLDIDISDKYR